MGDTFQTFPENFAHTVTVTWGDRQIEVRLVWRERAGAWYIDLFESDGTVFARGRRLSASGAPATGFGFEGTELPRDRPMIDVSPSDPDEQLDLGTSFETSLIALIFTEEELANAKTANAPTSYTTQVFLT